MSDWLNLNWFHYNLRESENWQQRHPTGPVHWDIQNRLTDAIEATDVPANELRAWLIARGWLKPW